MNKQDEVRIMKTETEPELKLPVHFDTSLACIRDADGDAVCLFTAKQPYAESPQKAQAEYICDKLNHAGLAHQSQWRRVEDELPETI